MDLGSIVSTVSGLFGGSSSASSSSSSDAAANLQKVFDQAIQQAMQLQEVETKNETPLRAAQKDTNA